MSGLRVSASNAPAMGDIRALGRGDFLVISADATERPDWPRYADAIMSAVTRGAEVIRDWRGADEA